MINLKSCTKCRGDMYLEKDSYGSFWQCLQCGFLKDLVEPPVRMPEVASPRGGKKRAADKPAA